MCTNRNSRRHKYTDTETRANVQQGHTFGVTDASAVMTCTAKRYTCRCSGPSDDVTTGPSPHSHPSLLSSPPPSHTPAEARAHTTHAHTPAARTHGPTHARRGRASGEKRPAHTLPGVCADRRTHARVEEERARRVSPCTHTAAEGVVCAWE